MTKKVVVDRAYMNLLRDKARLLDDIFTEGGKAVVINPDDFEKYDILYRMSCRLEDANRTGEEPYVERQKEGNQ
jgi:hypothetical protein